LHIIPAKSAPCEPPTRIHNASPVDNMMEPSTVPFLAQSGFTLNDAFFNCMRVGSYPHVILLACELSTNLSTVLSTTKLARRDGENMVFARKAIRKGKVAKIESYIFWEIKTNLLDLYGLPSSHDALQAIVKERK